VRPRGQSKRIIGRSLLCQCPRRAFRLALFITGLSYAGDRRRARRNDRNGIPGRLRDWALWRAGGVGVAIYDATAGRVEPTTIPRDHRMRDPENGTTPIRAKSGTVVAGNDIAQHDGGRGAGRGERIDADIAIVGSHAIDDG
jgi:hypothetical protein